MPALSLAPELPKSHRAFLSPRRYFALQSRMQSHAAYPGEKDDFDPHARPDDVIAAEAAAELRATQPQGSSMRRRSASEAPRGR